MENMNIFGLYLFRHPIFVSFLQLYFLDISRAEILANESLCMQPAE